MLFEDGNLKSWSEKSPRSRVTLISGEGSIQVKEIQLVLDF